MTIDNFNFADKKAIVRVDFNVPLDENGHVTDDTRIRGALPTLKKILADGGSLILMSHMGKPKGKVNPKFSLARLRTMWLKPSAPMSSLPLIVQTPTKLPQTLSPAKFSCSKTSVSILRKKANP